MKTVKRKLFLNKMTITGLNKGEMRNLYGGLPAVSGCTEECIPGGPDDRSVHDTLAYTCI